MHADDDFHVLADGVGAKPPTAISASRRNSPNAPEMISSPFITDCATRPARNPRRYSVIWKHASGLDGRPHADDAPVLDVASVRDADDPSGGDGGRILDERQYRPRQGVFLEQRSASITHTSGCLAALTPALIASAFPPFALSITTSSRWVSERRRPVPACVSRILSLPNVGTHQVEG